MANRIIILLLSALAFSACCPKIYEKIITEVEYRDTTIYKEIIRDSTVYVQIPLEKDQAIVHIGDTSHLETSVAESDAFIGEDGFLHHSLKNRSEKLLPVVVPIKEYYAYSNQANTATITRTEYKEKELTRWQKFRINGFWWLLSGLVGCLIWIFRTPLVALLKKFI